MQNICVIHPKRCTESATQLAEALGCAISNPYKEDREDYSGYDLVINYGVSQKIRYQRIINQPAAVQICKDKLNTLVLMEKAGVPVPWFSHSREEVLKRQMPFHDPLYVCHTQRDGMQNKGIEYRHADELVPAYLYTEYFFHKREYRVVVLMGRVIGIYRKQEVVDGTWDLIPLKDKGFDEIKKQCISAANALRISYVGFDVVANTRNDFKIIEANSGPIITDQTIEAFKQVLKV